MCTTVSNYPILFTAEENITTYKVVKNIKVLKFLWFKIAISAEALYNPFTYKFNRTYTTKLKGFRKDYINYQSRDGFYSYKYFEDAQKKYKDILCWSKFIVSCIIPKGSKYFLCKDIKTGETVYHSDKIKIVKILKNK